MDDGYSCMWTAVAGRNSKSGRVQRQIISSPSRNGRGRAPYACVRPVLVGLPPPFGPWPLVGQRVRLLVGDGIHACTFRCCQHGSQAAQARQLVRGHEKHGRAAVFKVLIVAEKRSPCGARPSWARTIRDTYSTPATRPNHPPTLLLLFPHLLLVPPRPPPSQTFITVQHSNLALHVARHVRCSAHRHRILKNIRQLCRLACSIWLSIALCARHEPWVRSVLVTVKSKIIAKRCEISDCRSRPTLSWVPPSIWSTAHSSRVSAARMLDSSLKTW